MDQFDVKLKRGVSGDLPEAIDPGALLFETDTGAMYVDDLIDGTEIRIPVSDPTKLSLTGTAASATKLAAERSIDGVAFDGTANIIHYATCATAATTAAKTANVPHFSLITGAEVTIKFTKTNTAANPTLNVSSTGAKPIYFEGNAISADLLKANTVFRFVYDGAGWLLQGGAGGGGDIDIATSDNAGLMSAEMFSKLYNIEDGATANSPSTAVPAEPSANGTAGEATEYARGDHSHPMQTTVSGNAGTATKLATARKINVSGALVGTATNFDGTKDIAIEVTSIAGEKVTGAVPQATKAVTDENGVNLATGYAKLPDAHGITLTVAGWNSSTKQQVVTVAGILADETKQRIDWMPKSTSLDNSTAAGIQCIAQAANQLTFRCSTVPTAAIKLYVTIQPVKYS